MWGSSYPPLEGYRLVGLGSAGSPGFEVDLLFLGVALRPAVGAVTLDSYLCTSSLRGFLEHPC